jgi:hypothetical protein
MCAGAGPAGEADARSCHQEVVRLAKVAAAAKHAAPTEDDGITSPSASGAPAIAPIGEVGHDIGAYFDPKGANVNGYLAAADLLAHLRLVVPAERALAAATGERL